jgi:predicted transcriptional regulator
MTLREIIKILDGEIIYGEDELDTVINAGSAADLMSDVLYQTNPGAILLTGLVNPQVVRTAEMAEIKAICFVRGKKPDNETIRLAREKQIPLLATDLPMYEACGRLYKQRLRGRNEGKSKVGA